MATRLTPSRWQKKSLKLLRLSSQNELVPGYDHVSCLLARAAEQSRAAVDDCSTDRTGAIARSCGVEVLTAKQNQGSKARAINLAIPEIKEDLMVIVDADTTLATNALHKLMHAFSDTKVMVACGMVHSRNHGSIWEKSRYAEYLCTQYIVKRAQGNARMVLVASGCFSCFRTEWLKDAGGFPERTMAEDMDLTWSAIIDGYRVALVMNAHCTVTDPQDWKTYKGQLLRWYRGFMQCMRVRKFWMHIVAARNF